jgi:hypothetical protein
MGVMNGEMSAIGRGSFRRQVVKASPRDAADYVDVYQGHTG